MQNGCELRAVIDGQLIQLAGGFGFCVGIGIVPAYEPEYRRHLPRGTEATKVLACGGGAGVLDSVEREIPAERLGNTVARGGVVHIQRIAVKRRDLRLAWSAGRLGLGVDDSLDRRQHMRPDAGVEGTHVEFDYGLVRYDVFLG